MTCLRPPRAALTKYQMGGLCNKFIFSTFLDAGSLEIRIQHDWVTGRSLSGQIPSHWEASTSEFGGTEFSP